MGAFSFPFLWEEEARMQRTVWGAHKVWKLNEITKCKSGQVLKTFFVKYFMIIFLCNEIHKYFDRSNYKVIFYQSLEILKIIQILFTYLF